MKIVFVLEDLSWYFSLGVEYDEFVGVMILDSWCIVYVRGM